MTDVLKKTAVRLLGLIPAGKEPATEALLQLPALSFKQCQFIFKTLKKYEFTLKMVGVKLPPEPSPPIQLPAEPHFVDFINGKFILRLGDKHATSIHIVPKAKYDKKTALYAVPYRLQSVLKLHTFVKEVGLFYTETAKQAILAMYREMRERHSASMAQDADLDLRGFGLPCEPYQIAGIKGAIRFLRGFIADSMGLGKTRQALGVLHLTQSYPAVVICPPSVVLNWEKEAIEGLVPPGALKIRNGKPFRIFRAKSRSAPKHTCAAGKQLSLLDLNYFNESCAACCFQQSDLIIVNYHKLYSGWKCEFGEDGKKIKGRKRQKGERAEVQLSEIGAAIKLLGLRSIIIDESTYVKNEATQTTKAVAEIATGTKVRLALSGTPIKNRVSELVAPLKILDRLDDLGGEDVFYRQYCDSTVGNVQGSSEGGRLNKMLRAIGFIQRNKRDVRKDLPPIRHATQWVEIDNWDEYHRVETDLVNWCAEQAVLKEEFQRMLEDLPGDVQEALIQKKMIETRIRIMKAQALIKVGALKRVTAKGKVAAIKEWVADFLTSENKLVLYAHHRHIQKALIDTYNCLHVTGADAMHHRQKHIDIFQGNCGNFEGLNAQLMVISDAAREGVNLDAADDIVRVELPWSPADEDQIIARVDRHRAHNITAWNLVADKTIEVKILALLEKKRKIVSEVTTGGATAAEIEQAKRADIFDDLFSELAGMSTHAPDRERVQLRAKELLLSNVGEDAAPRDANTEESDDGESEALAEAAV